MIYNILKCESPDWKQMSGQQGNAMREWLLILWLKPSSHVIPRIKVGPLQSLFSPTCHLPWQQGKLNHTWCKRHLKSTNYLKVNAHASLLLPPCTHARDIFSYACINNFHVFRSTSGVTSLWDQARNQSDCIPRGQDSVRMPSIHCWSQNHHVLASARQSCRDK